MNSLRGLSTCDIADALQRLSLPSQITDAAAVIPGGGSIIGPAHTIKFVAPSSTAPAASNHHVDTCPAGSVIVISTPKTINAVWGGLMSSRAKVVGCAGVVVDGRVRDVAEIVETGVKVWATRGRSVLGAAGFLRPTGLNEPVTLCEDSGYPVMVRNGDIVVADADGAVCVPIERCEEVAALAEKIRSADAKVLVDVLAGETLVDSFKRHR